MMLLPVTDCITQIKSVKILMLKHKLAPLTIASLPKSFLLVVFWTLFYLLRHLWQVKLARLQRQLIYYREHVSI